MSHLIVADLHGSVSAAAKLESIVNERKPECILLLGDILRGAPDEDNYRVANILNSLPCGFIAVKGNCDYMSDRYALNHDLPIDRALNLYGWQIHMQHYPYATTPSPRSIYLYGHTHRKELWAVNGGVICNPGSIALPRDGVPSYAELDQKGIRLLDANTSEIIKEIPFLNMTIDSYSH
ncbi:MAG: YfcE family phosphodiesterase [Bacilli bacterium]|nr:YfcE family phosphodiesterase [Bacilli bacterium]